MTVRKISNQNRDFKGVWIPAKFWLDENLKPMEMLFLVEIDSLDSGNRGCFASNKHFSEFFGLTPGRCSQIIQSLQKKGYIKIEYVRDGKQIINRSIRVVNNLNTPVNKLKGGIKNAKGGYIENCKESNTDFSNTYINTTTTNSYKSRVKNQDMIHYLNSVDDELVEWITSETEKAPQPSQRYFESIVKRLMSINAMTVEDATRKESTPIPKIELIKLAD